ncbi:MAG: serpin family protein [Bacteroidetes bacterium]|nr:serpin family protein [Bacteroidota bacterium]NCQ10755.1 serpin family protein [Bacteroidota bacterium]
MKKTSVLFLLFLSLILTQCDLFSNDSNDPDTPKQITLNDSQKELLVQSNNFGIQLFKSVPVDKNLMISPLSASIALSMLLNGTNGETATQMKDMLGYSGQSFTTINSSYENLLDQLLSADSKVNISVANAIFYRESFPVKLDYLSTLKDSYNAEVKGLDFARADAVSTINSWASKQTNGKINKVINEINQSTVLFLMNALYFKGNWSNQFDKDDTSDQNFYLSNGNSIKTPFMHGDVDLIFAESNGLRAIELPYGRKNFSMILLLPDYSISEIYDRLSAETWNTLTSQLSEQNYWREATVILPKFTFSYQTFLSNQLKSLGMIDAFDPNLADLRGISDNGNLFVSFVKQNTFVDVNEEGTEAAAVTTIGVELTSAPSIDHYVFDKPFVFMIRERTTNAFLFAGTVLNPAN